MAGRIRSIKPEILDDEEAAGLSDAAWRLWVSVWLLADDAGNTRAGDKYLAGQVWQDTNRASSIPTLLEELATSRRLEVYENSGERYAHIRNWELHQRIDNAGKPRVKGPEHEKSIRWAKSRGDSPRVAAVRGLTNDQRPTTNDPDHRPADSSESVGLDQPSLELIAQSPSPPRFDFEAVYKAHWVRKEGKSDGMEICERDIRSEADFQQWTKAVKNYAALMRAEGREVKRQKHFSTFMGCWRDYIDATPPVDASSVMNPVSAEKGRSLF